ncbi:MAG: ATP-binding protein [Ktedonobacteraceae bacterium]|nr:ATP-binding protein [Ktedonobacteraceae bacterium]
MQQVQGKQPKGSVRLRVIGFIVALLVLIVGAAYWIMNSLNSPLALFTTIFGALATIFTFLQLHPIIFAHKSPEPAQPAQAVPATQPIIHINVSSSPQPVHTSSTSTTTIPASSPAVSSPADLLTLRTFPLPTDPRPIQQREAVVKDIYALLVDPNTSAVVLTGLGGIGKSTLAALVLNYAERERHVGRGPFRTETILLRINENTTFLELASNIFAAVGKSAPDLSKLPPQNQAFAVYNALNSADTPCLIVLDQFENLLDQQSGRALLEGSGVGELLDALNSQPCTSRLLLTSRPRPHGTRNDALASLRIHPVGGLDSAEGAALLRSQDVMGSEDELHEAVHRCDGHPLSLTLLSTLLQTYAVGLTPLLHDSAYTQLWRGRIAQNLLDRIFSKLQEPSRQLLCAFSVYREAVVIDAAQAVMANTTKEQALIALESLLQQHLIQAQGSDGQYQLHPIVATYAHQHFVMHDEAANTQSRQAAHGRAVHYYLHVATTHCPADDQRRRISDVQPLIEAVWQLAQAGQFQEAYELMLRESLFGNLRRWGANSILLELCQLLLSENWQLTPPQHALICSNIASVSSMLGKKQEALEYYQQDLAISREVGDRGGEGTTLNNLGRVYNGLGKKQEALEYYQQALELHRMVQNPFMEGITLHNMGLIYSTQRRYEVALACLLLAKALFEQVQSPCDVDDEVRWIANLRKSIGEKLFTTLLAQVEPRAEQIVQEALRKK